LWGLRDRRGRWTSEALEREQYRGIRPCPGYPACPDHSEKATLFRLLDAENAIGLQLTESFAMYPASSVSGYYFSHPSSQYFVVGRLSREQVRRLRAAPGRGARAGRALARRQPRLRPGLSHQSSRRGLVCRIGIRIFRRPARSGPTFSATLGRTPPRVASVAASTSR
jgi:hypothetical protein